MAAATILTIADALADALNAHTFSPPYDGCLGAVRIYAPRYSPEQVQRLRVTVIPYPYTAELITRGVYAEGDFQVGVGVQQRTDWTEDNQKHGMLDALMLLTEEIVRFCLALDVAEGSCTAVELSPAYDENILRDDGTFTAVLLCTFKAALEVTPP